MQKTQTSSSSSTETGLGKEVDEVAEDLAFSQKAAPIKVNIPDEVTLNDLYVNASDYTTIWTSPTAAANNNASTIGGLWTGGSALGTCDDKSYYTYHYDANYGCPLSYTNLDGLEEVVMLKRENIAKMVRKVKTIFKWLRVFPFFSLKHVNCTEVTYWLDDSHKALSCIYALECPSRLAKKIGLQYEKTSSQDLVEDDLMAL